MPASACVISPPPHGEGFSGTPWAHFEWGIAGSGDHEQCTLDAAPIRRIEASATRTGVTVSTQQRPYGERAGPHFLSWKDFGVYQVRGRGGGVAFAVDKHKKQDKFNTLLGATDPQSALPLLTQPGGGEAGVRVKGGRGGAGHSRSTSTRSRTKL